MRGRRGGIIGDQPQASSGALPGVWRASDILPLQRLSAWPNNFIQVSIPQSLDVTDTGAGGISATVVSSYNSPDYQWQKSTDGGAAWANVPGATGGSLELTGQTASNDEDLYRVIASKGVRSATSNSLQVQREASVTFTFFGQPQSQTIFNGQTVTFSVFASAVGAKYGGLYSPAYQWQFSADGGSTWTDIAGETDYFLEFPVTPEDNGKRYRAKITSLGATGYSDAATLTVQAISISLSPSSVIIGDGSADITATATTQLSGPITYRWFVVKRQWTGLQGWQVSEREIVGATYFVHETYGGSAEAAGNELLVRNSEEPIEGLSISNVWCKARAEVGGFSAESELVEVQWEDVVVSASVSPELFEGAIGTPATFALSVQGAVGPLSGRSYTNLSYLWEVAYKPQGTPQGTPIVWISATEGGGSISQDGLSLNTFVLPKNEQTFGDWPEHLRSYRVSVSVGSTLRSILSFETRTA